MTRDEWFKSPEFMKQRLMNNIAHEIGHKSQYLRDLLMIHLDEKGGFIGDRFDLAERQLRIIELEAKNLVSVFNNLLKYPKFDDDAVSLKEEQNVTIDASQVHDSGLQTPDRCQ